MLKAISTLVDIFQNILEAKFDRAFGINFLPNFYQI